MRSVDIFKSNRTGLFAGVTVSPIEVTNGSETNGFGLPFSDPLLLRRAINIGFFFTADENRKSQYPGHSITAERNFNARSFDEFVVDFPERENLTDLIAKRHSSP